MTYAFCDLFNKSILYFKFIKNLKFIKFYGTLCMTLKKYYLYTYFLYFLCLLLST